MTTTDVRWIEPLGHRIDATVDVPGSKSINNRVLLLAGLAKGNSTLQQWLNVAIYTMHKDGYVDDTWIKWFGIAQVHSVQPSPYF